jgi:hypothetical protein
MPFRSRWMLARNAAASVASPIARVRPARDPNLPNRRMCPIGKRLLRRDDAGH